MAETCSYCHDCARPAYYDTETDDYHHATDPGRGCFLIPAEDRPEDPTHPLHGNDRAEMTIPGTFTATYAAGTITRMTFTPLASFAGYFGPAAEVVDGNEDLEVSTTDGPFWRAMQGALGRVAIEWTE
jgi:hypothetical protein